MLSDNTLVQRVVTASEEINKIKTSQSMGGDNAKLYTYSTTFSATVQSNENGRWIDYHKLIGFRSDIPFCLASASLKVSAGGTEITTWYDVSRYNFWKSSSNGVWVQLLADSSLGFHELQNTPTSASSSLFQTYWEVNLYGWSTSAVYPLTLATGTTVQVTLTIKANQEGKFI